ncbi:MAG: ankyrin repeat domain-containing protein [Synergistaceae bacterium]|nr:ankyrin repeat domain-containing protein [Synergistaceae bacterium]
MQAVENNKNPEIIAALINAGANTNVKRWDRLESTSYGGMTALDIARSRNNVEAIKLLEPVTAMKDDDFLELCKTVLSEQIKKEIKLGANVNAKADVNVKPEADRWATALMLSAKYNSDPEVITVLLRAGTDIKAQDYRALMSAAGYNKNPEVIKVLINAGADVNAKDAAGKTALDYALSWRNKLTEHAIRDAMLPTFKKSAEQGDAEAQYNLGMMYANGNGVAEDQWEAVVWLRKAAKQGHKAARNELARRGIYE